MSTSPLHHKNNDKEIVDILSCNWTVGPSLAITISYCDKTKTEDKEFVQLVFSDPVRVDIYEDEGRNLSFDDAKCFEKVSEEIPGILKSKSSKYLNLYLKNEPVAESFYSEDLSHFVIWSYASGVIHVLANNEAELIEL